MDYSTPSLPLKLKSLTEALCWASGAPVYWRKQKDAPRIREANRGWLEVQLMRIKSLGRDENRIDEEGNVHQIGQRVVMLQINTRSRSQEFDQSAWLLAEETKTRVISLFSRVKWLAPFDMSVADTTDVLDIPEGFKHDSRIEDTATFELHLNTFISSSDVANIVYFIEQIEVTSNIRNSGGDPLDESLQLDSEVM